MANGSFLGDIKARLGIGSRGSDGNDDRYDYDEYDEYEEYDEYDDGRGEVYDSYMERGVVTTRGARGPVSPNLVSANDARESARKFTASSENTPKRPYGRTMVDSSLPPSMTAEGTAAVSAASNSKRDGLSSLFGPEDDGKSQKSASKPLSFLGGDSGRSTKQPSMPGRRQLQVIRPRRYEDAEAVTEVLKGNDAAIVVFRNVDKGLMMRMLDFSFGAASALDASVEALGNGVFAICRDTGLDERELDDLRNQGVI